MFNVVVVPETVKSPVTVSPLDAVNRFVTVSVSFITTAPEKLGVTSPSPAIASAEIEPFGKDTVLPLGTTNPPCTFNPPVIVMAFV